MSGHETVDGRLPAPCRAAYESKPVSSERGLVASMDVVYGEVSDVRGVVMRGGHRVIVNEIKAQHRRVRLVGGAAGRGEPGSAADDDHHVAEALMSRPRCR